MRWICRIGFHAFRFRRPTYFGTGALEICKRCGKGRILHFAGAYEYFDPAALAALTTGADGVAAENEAGLDGLRRLAGDRDFSNAFVGESTRLYFDAERARMGDG